MTAAFKRHICTLGGTFQTILGLQEYRLDFEFSDEAEGDTAAKIVIRLDYLTLRATIFPRLYQYWLAKDYENVAETVCHELCHVLTEPLYLKAIDATTNLNVDALEEIRERQTQRVCNSVFRLVPKSRWKPKA